MSWCQDCYVSQHITVIINYNNNTKHLNNAYYAADVF